jgi:hypothetical protein
MRGRGPGSTAHSPMGRLVECRRTACARPAGEGGGCGCGLRLRSRLRFAAYGLQYLPDRVEGKHDEPARHQVDLDHLVVTVTRLRLRLRLRL